jgi:hypothetical protein
MTMSPRHGGDVVCLINMEEINMGNGKWNPDEFKNQAIAAVKSENSGFSATSMCDEFNPARIKKEGRWSKQGAFNDFALAITVLGGLDVSGSMDEIPKSLVKAGLGNLMADLNNIFNRPYENLQFSFAAIGDAKTDTAPLQVTHFESDNRFAEWLQRLWLEKGGGANGAESYNLLWWYAANKTHLNYVQDGRKGILFTIGDDNVHPGLTADEIQMWLDPNYEGKDMANKEILADVRKQYDVYHIVITDGDSYSYDFHKKQDKTKAQQNAEAKQWADLLGENNVVYSNSRDVVNAITKIVMRHRPAEQPNMSALTRQQWVKKTKENLTDKQWVEVLSYTLCPLSHEYMSDPVDWGNHKRGYQSGAVERYVRIYQKDPITKRKTTLPELNLKQNRNIAQLCLSYKPYFDALPKERKERLIQLTLPDPISDEYKKIMESGVVQVGMFSKSVPILSPMLPSSVSPVPPAAVSPAPPSAPARVPPDLSAVLNVDSDNIPDIFLCTINRTVMDKPVLAKDGFPYEESVIAEWFEKNNTSPMTGAVIDKELTSLNFIKSEIVRWKELQAAKSAVPATSVENQAPKSSVPPASVASPKP